MFLSPARYWIYSRIILGVVLLMLCSVVHATGSHYPPATSPTPKPVSSHSSSNSASNSASVSTAKSASRSDSQAKSASSSKLQNSGNSRSRSTATGGAATGGQGNASASVGNVSPTLNSQNSAQGGMSTAVSAPVVTTSASNGDQETIIHGDTTNYEAPRMPVSTAIAGGTNTTADCRYSVGAGAQAAIAGLSFGVGRKDKDCQRQQLAEYFYARGNPEAGDVLMCRIRELRDAFGPECLEWLRRSRVIVVQPTAHQLEQREQFERGDHLK